MNMLAHNVKKQAAAHPGWALCGVLLVAFLVCLPALHHLGDCHDSGPSGTPCYFCLILNFTFLAIPLGLFLDLVRRCLAVLARQNSVLPTAVDIRRQSARGPPFSG